MGELRLLVVWRLEVRGGREGREGCGGGQVRGRSSVRA